MKKIAKYASHKKGVWVILLAWIILTGALSAAPSVNDYKVNTGENDLPTEAQSVVASEKFDAYFPDDNGLFALLVFHNEEGWNTENSTEVDEVSKWIQDDSKLETIQSAVPFHQFPEQAKKDFLSEDGTTLVLPLFLKDKLEMDEVHDTVESIEEFTETSLTNGTMVITGPAGIASDTIAIFSNADLVLLFSTIALVLILLIVIYRSPLLAIIPLVAVAFVYQVVDRVLGLLSKNDVFTVEAQSISIVMILLFGATVDYSLFVFSRFREELRKQEDKHEAMRKAVRGIAEPLIFSGGTVFAAMLVLLLADYGPYNSFAPVFTITIAIVLIAGLTLIPALFTIFGRRAFWPFVPKVGEETLEKNRFWGKVGGFVTKKPILAGGLVLVFLLLNASQLFNANYSYNIIQSFPEEMKSRIGFEQLEEKFPAGELAPVNVLVEKEIGFAFSNRELDAIERLNESFLNMKGVSSTTLPEKDMMATGGREGSRILSEDGKALKFDIILTMNPYEAEAMDILDQLTESKQEILRESGLDANDYDIYFAGETATSADIRSTNDRDTMLIVVAVTIVIFGMLIFHTRSLVAPVYMMTTILLSYASALGLSWFIFDTIFGFEGMSYRIPLYAFVFLVALGVDYNIMLISRIKEENRSFSTKEATRRGVALTGGVISSAGIILAATFGVLMTQPILELFMFGFIVCIGILLDAFLIRGMLVPAIVTLLKDWNWWPSKVIEQKSQKERE
ncbi:MMPL family transporter [Sutcliffiella horikoshii]|uniref:MMPL family transporter n=1 Tax=Sutcliffiella horikoshii TaxID=79883 RepID=UPI001EEE6438|nr:MMPL family transporter [Sutcliffiella horikoshii]MCG1023531.1 MMPL family transporter [Sutcliffiella horikoshii]